MGSAKKLDRVNFVPFDNRRLAALCGQFDENIRNLERQLEVQIHSRGNKFEIQGSAQSVKTACRVLYQLYQETALEELTPAKIHLIVQEHRNNAGPQNESTEDFVNVPEVVPIHDAILTKAGQIKARNPNQKLYLNRISQYDINFGVGPAGTGKTYLAVAAAVNALERNQVQKLILVRPAVEAGEHLGFLPGDLSQKVDPYLRPLYDALFQMMGGEKVTKLVERNIIEVAPLAYMRGRTLNDAFVILDEAQNTTKEQMKMFLTRIGFGSKVVVTGDITQIDLPRDKQSGLKQAIDLLLKIDDISFTFFSSHDVVRHPLVEAIVKAYEEETPPKNNQASHKNDGHS